MPVSHSATRALATAMLLVGLAACSHDEGPSPFNPDGMSADLTSAQDAFDSPVAASFDATGDAIAVKLGATAPAVISPMAALLRPTGAKGYAAKIARMLPQSSRISASVAAIPTDLLGTTFVWDVETSAYVASDRPDAPETGVRFILYAVNPVTRQPVDPLDELGYVDVTDVTTAAGTGARVVVYADGVTYLDYTVIASGTSTSGTLTVSGSASNGATRATYTLQNTIAQNSNGMLLTLDYSLAIPTRGLRVDYTVTFGNITPDQVAVTLDFSVSGRNGDVTLSGTYGASGGTFSAKVNGSIFATITLDESSEPIVTGASGGVLTAEEEAVAEVHLRVL